tara:strand:- start:28875 stop:29180 length:306 start_codon:yes stop_codon:yes gene_type:complete
MKSNNKQIVELIEKRLKRGARDYGAEVPFDDTRDHLQDALEEALDMAVYLTAKIIEIQRRESKWLIAKRKITMICSKLNKNRSTTKWKKWMNSLNIFTKKT